MTIEPRATTAIVESDSWRAALDIVVPQVLDGADAPPDLAVLFASVQYGVEFATLVPAARASIGATTLIGCSAEGFLAGSREVEHRAGLSLIAFWLPGVCLHATHIARDDVPLFADAERWHAAMGIPHATRTDWLVLADPYRFDVRGVIDGFVRMYPGRALIGGLASGSPEARTASMFLDDAVFDGGGVALGIGGAYALRAFASQGCTPVGETWTITGVNRNTLQTISNRPAVDVLRDTIAALPEDQRPRAHQRVTIGFAVDEYQDEFHRGDFLVRGLLGLDAHRGAIVVGGEPRKGQTIQFHLRDPKLADIDLHQMLTEVRAATSGTRTVAGLLCTCAGRGQRLFGVPHHDSVAVQAALGPLPCAGFFCKGEIAPLRDRARLQAFSASLGLLVYDPVVG